MVSHEAIVFICIVSAGAAVLLGWAFYRLYSDRGANEELKDADNEQAIYMREHRQRNRQILAERLGYRGTHCSQ